MSVKPPPGWWEFSSRPYSLSDTKQRHCAAISNVIWLIFMLCLTFPSVFLIRSRLMLIGPADEICDMQEIQTCILIQFSQQMMHYDTYIIRLSVWVYSCGLHLNRYQGPSWSWCCCRSEWGFSECNSWGLFPWQPESLSKPWWLEKCWIQAFSWQ